MRHSEGQIQTLDGLTLYTQTWLPDGDLKAVVAFSHGMAEHSGRYAHVGAALAGSGYALYMADLRGHGKSPGRRGHIMSWDEYRRDMVAITDGARQISSDAMHFFGGHSVGGLLALDFALDNPSGFAGAFVSGPSLRLAFEPPAWKVAVGKLVSGLIPGITMGNEIDPAALSRDPANAQSYANDPMVHGKISARAFTEFVAAMNSTMARAGELRIPLLIMHGVEDSLSAASASQEFYDRVALSDKTLHLYEGLYHEIFNELEEDRRRVFADLVAWLDAHI